MFGLFNKKKGKPGLLGISLIDKELAFAHMGSDGGQPVLRACELLTVASPQDGGKILADKMRNLGLEQTRCNFVLSPDDYSLLLVEAPNVEPAELAAAAKWKIKDMIDRPLEQLAVSVFPVPRDAYRAAAAAVEDEHQRHQRGRARLWRHPRVIKQVRSPASRHVDRAALLHGLRADGIGGRGIGGRGDQREAQGNSSKPRHRYI